MIVQCQPERVDPMVLDELFPGLGKPDLDLSTVKPVEFKKARPPDALVLMTIETVCGNCSHRYSHPNQNVMLRFGSRLVVLKGLSATYDKLPKEKKYRTTTADACERCFREGATLLGKEVVVNSLNTKLEGVTKVSHDVFIIDPKTEETRQLKSTNSLTGGTYALGGTNEAWLNITYNYGKHYHKLWGHGLKGFHHMKVAEVKPRLEAAITELGSDRSDDYWEGTEGNAGAALKDLLALFTMCEDGDEVQVY